MPTNTTSSASFQADNNFSGFEFTSYSPVFSQMISDCFGRDEPITKIYPPYNSKNRAKRLRKKFNKKS
jgi:hypothetical protein